MASFFTESNRLAAVFGRDFARRIRQEFEMTVLLDPQISFGDIVDLLNRGGKALWLDRDCVLADTEYKCVARHRYCRYTICAPHHRRFALFQVPGTTERGAPLPALEYIIDRITNYERLDWFSICAENDDDDLVRTLDVSPECFSHLLQTSREALAHRRPYQRRWSVELHHITLTAEQTELLFTHVTSPIFMHLQWCRFHGPTLLQLGSQEALRREQNHVLGQGSYLVISLREKESISFSHDELTALLSIPHLRMFYQCPMNFNKDDIGPYKIVKNFVYALAANKISRLESLHFSSSLAEIEWEKDKEPSTWVDFWKAIEGHPSLKEVHLGEQAGSCQPWQPIAAAVKVNPRLVHVYVEDCGFDHTWKTKLDEHVEPLLERNHYHPKIASLCRTDLSKVAALLVQAIVAIACKRNIHSRCKREIHRMLLDQLILTGYDFGVSAP